MSVPFKPVLMEFCGDRAARRLAHYQNRGGYAAARKCVTQLKPDEIIELVKTSGLRGRGGAGFPTGMKWGFVPKNSTKPKYLVINADESEPGTFKDRIILEFDPHTVIDGAICAAASVGIKHIYVYIRGEFIQQTKVFEAAVAEAYAAGFLGTGIFGSNVDLDLTVHRGAGAYICGEETGMLSSLEGGRGYPKLKPPFPAVEGLFGCPTIVNNVETIATVPFIIERGAKWFRQWGTEKSAGFKIFSVSGHVEKPGNFEVPLGIPLMELIDKYAGGVWKGRKLKCCIPGGSSAPPLTAEECTKVNLDYESLAAAGTMLGSGGIIVLDDQTCMVDACYNLMRFYHHESCGQCTPCREGTGWLEKMFARMEHGGGDAADLAVVDEVGWNMRGQTICVLADAAAMPAQAFIQKWRDEFEAHARTGACPFAAGTGGTREPMSPAAVVPGLFERSAR